MKISLVINTKNPKLEWLKQAIESAQGFDEKVLYFDGQIADEGLNKEYYGIKYLGDGQSRTIPEGFNHAIKQSNGNWICPFCDDDYFNSSHLEELLQEIRTGKFDDAGIIHFPIHTEGGSWGSAEVNDNIMISNMIPFSSFIRREVFEMLGGYREDLKVYHDWNFWLRAYKAKVVFKFFSLPIYTFRMGHDSASHRQINEVGGQQIAAEMVRLHA